MHTRSSVILVGFFLLLAHSSALAQNGGPPPPPPPAPDYSPKAWKEYSFTDDNIRFKFPVEPKPKESTVGTEKHAAHVYSRQSFMLFELTVVPYPVEIDLEANKNMLAGAVHGGLDWVKNLEPKVLEERDIFVDGHPAKFMKIETNNGLVMRWECFAVKNKMYSAYAISKKGERHGFNWENDFEVPAMGFLDSLHVIGYGQMPTPSAAPAEGKMTRIGPVPPTESYVDNGVFVSREGRFSIGIPELPKETINKATEKAKVKGVDAGKQYLWIFERGLFTIYYNPPVNPDGNPSPQVYMDMENGTRKGILSGKATLISEKPIKLGANRGTEFRYALANGVHYINRIYLVSDMGYQIVAGYADPENEQKMLDVLNSFTPQSK